MSKVKVHINFSSAVRSLRNTIKKKYIASVQTPGVKTEIYTNIYSAVADKIPEDTGALKYSPLTGGTAEYMGNSKYKKYKNNPHYAQGDITDEGLEFNPYSIEKDSDGQTVYYAKSVTDFKPYQWIKERSPFVREIVKDTIVKEMNDG